MGKVHNFGKGNEIQRKAAAIHKNSKKQGKKLNRAIKETYKKLKSTAYKQFKNRQKIDYLQKNQGKICAYCHELHATSSCAALRKKREKKVKRASKKRAKKLRKKFRQIDKRSDKEEEEGRTDAIKKGYVTGKHTSSDCPALIPIVPGSVPVFDFSEISDKNTAEH
jgi:hypothetical protein